MSDIRFAELKSAEGRGGSPKETLVVVCAGDDSRHIDYSGGSNNRPFDLMIIYFGSIPDRYVDDGEYYIRKEGFKWQLIFEVATSNAELFKRYRYVWLPDDDISMTQRDLRLFGEIVASFELKVAQPAIKWGPDGTQVGTMRPLTRGVDFAHPITLWRPDVLLRYVNFVEIMAPMFSLDAFLAVLPYFKNKTFGWGLDYGYSSMFAPGDVAIVDQTPMKHTRVLRSGELYRKGKLKPRLECQETMKLFGLEPPYVTRTLASVSSRRGIRLMRLLRRRKSVRDALREKAGR